MKLLNDQIAKLRTALTAEPHDIATALSVVEELEAMTKFSSMLKHEWRTIDTAPPTITCLVCRLNFGDVRAKQPCAGIPVVNTSVPMKKKKHARVPRMSRSRTR